MFLPHQQIFPGQQPSGKSKQSATRSKINTPGKMYKIICFGLNNKNNHPYSFESNKNECFDLNLYQ